MTTTLSAAPSAVLADRVLPRTLAGSALLVAAGAAVTAAAAQLAVPLWPVPITGQTLAVLLVGATLGARRGALAMALYAVLGIAGLPVFSDAAGGWQVLAGPTGGYIIGFIAAAALTGWLAERRWDRTVLRAVVAFSAGTVLPFAFGLPWLAWSLQLDLPQTLAAGLWPFLVGGAIKAAVAAGIVRAGWAYFGRRDRA
jgi:biotin transport system substrate-specific component